MRYLILLINFSLVLNNCFSQTIDPKERTFNLGNFLLESGITLPNAYIKYATYGSLNKDSSNAILLPSSYSSDYNGYNFLIGKDKSLDTSKYFLILPELFANGHSSSPSNTPAPFHGPNFPITTIRDNVIAEYQLISKNFKIKKLKSVIGFSMGGQQAFQWAISYPQIVESIVAFCATAKTYPHGNLRLESAISTLESDSYYDDGNYTSPPLKGLKAWSLHWASWFLSQDWFRLEKYKELGFETLSNFIQNRIDKEKIIDANDRIHQARTWEFHDISNNNVFKGNIELALAAIECNTLYMPSESDLYFPLSEALYENKFIPKIQFTPIQSVWGHLAGAGLSQKDNEFLNATIKAFLDN